MKATSLALLLAATLTATLNAQVQQKQVPPDQLPPGFVVPNGVQLQIQDVQGLQIKVPQGLQIQGLRGLRMQDVKAPNLPRFQVGGLRQPQVDLGGWAFPAGNVNQNWNWNLNAGQNQPAQVRDYAMKQIEHMRVTCKLSEKQVRTLRIAAKGVSHRLKQKQEAARAAAGRPNAKGQAILVWGRGIQPVQPVQQWNGHLKKTLNNHALWKRTLARVLTKTQQQQWAQTAAVTTWPQYGVPTDLLVVPHLQQPQFQPVVVPNQRR